MPLHVLCCATVASFKLILFGPICVECKCNFALDSAEVDFPKKALIFFVQRCWDFPDPLFDRFFS